MAVDPQAKQVLDFLAQMNMPALSSLDPAVLRKQRSSRRLPQGPDADVRDHTLAGPGGEIAVRRYRPRDAHGTLGGFVWFHGGGFVIGSIAEHDHLCRQFAVSSGCAVFSVEYRLAPEHKFPAAVDDAYAAARWVHASAAEHGVDPARIAVGGDSAGGNLATVVAALARQRGGPPLVLQVLIYPVTDLRSLDTPSYHENAQGYLLTRADMLWFRDQYLSSPEQRALPLVSPLASTELGGLPRALVITAEYDPLRDEGEAYARALQAAGVPVTLERYDGMIHTFTALYPLIAGGRASIDLVASELRAAFG
jgi:acetyl esterase